MPQRPWQRRRVRPGSVLILGLVGLIALGALLLSLPAASVDGREPAPLDAVFTATSAACVTGLIVRDTGGDFSLFGQAVILALIQLGGLGIMVATGMVSLLLGRGLGMGEAGMIRDLFESRILTEARSLIRFIIVMTLVAELLGAVALWFGLAAVEPEAGPRLWSAAFHSVSAFCNAGFSLYPDSLIGVAGSPLAIGAVTTLLVVGGLGFTVVANVLAWSRGRALRRRRRGPPSPIYVQARVVLTGTAILLLGGGALLALVEWNGALAGLGTGERLSLAFFQSATCRTAGFNTMDLTALSPAALFAMIVLMSVGGAPGSTAGGLKITTVAILGANLRSISRGVNEARLARRELSRRTVRRAFMILTSWIVVSVLAFEILLICEGGEPMALAFEVISALGTVGLSLDVTPTLSPLGRVIVVLLMFLGRLGPLAVAYGLVPPTRERGVRFPEAAVQVG